MRKIETFVIRLMTNSDEPLALRGMLHAVASGEAKPFTDGLGLLALLRQMQGRQGSTLVPDGDPESKKEADET